MSRPRGSLASDALLAAVAAGTAWIAMYSWRDFDQAPGGFLNPLFLLAVVVGGTGVAARWWRWPGPAVLALQAVVSAVVACLLLTGSPLPVGGAFTELRAVLGQAVDSSQQYSAPVPASVPPIDPILILSGLLCLLLVDLLACTARRVPLAGLPLLTIYSIPVSMVDSAVAWWVFAATAAGFLTMLFLQESDQVARWGRPIAEDQETGHPISFTGGRNTLRSTAGSIGSVATALAVVVPLLIPTVGIHVFDFGPGSGSGDDIRVDNPVADLVRDLKRGDDTPLVRVTTTDPDPSYLRILTLTRFSNAEWSPGDRDVPVDQRASGLLPAPQGVPADVSRDEVPYDVTVLPTFSSRWLPTQVPASRIQADGDWRYDEGTMDFLAVPDDLDTAGMHYTMDALDLDLTADRLKEAGTSAGKVSEVFSDLPADLPPIVRQLAVEVTKDQTTLFDKAVALQDWFRQDGGFQYSLEPDEGDGSDALERFLTEGPGGRVGYCEQFASAMAVMARALGIPARVDIGFLDPAPAGPDQWVYSSDDMHAWPELYFDGAGWVRFEPTPAARAEDVPSYTDSNAGPQVQDPGPTRTRSSKAPAAPNSRPTQSQDTAAAVGQDRSDGGGFAWGPSVGGVLGVAIVVGLLLVPRTVRRRRRERRLDAGGPEEVWAELRDTAVDLGVPWPPGRSPRATGETLAGYLGEPLTSTTPDRPAHGPAVTPEGVAAVHRIVAALERLRYSRPGSAPESESLRDDAATVEAALVGGAPRSARRRADWWPRSVLSFAARRPHVAPGTVEARYGGVIDHAG